MAAEPVLEWTRDEIVEFIDEQAKRRRGVSAAALLAAYAQGRLAHPGEVADLLALADLLPDDDPLWTSPD